MYNAKDIKKLIKRSHLDYKAHIKKLKKRATKEYKDYPSIGKHRPSAKGRVIVMDSENRGLLPSLHWNSLSDGHVIHCRDKETGEKFVFFDPYEFRRESDRVWMEAEGEQDGFYLDGIKFLNEADVIISQNWLGYDHHALYKLSGGLLNVDFEAKPRGGKKRRLEYPFRVMDTMIMSQLLNPDRKPPRAAYAAGAGNVGPHSIEAHGYRMGEPKPVQEQWDYLEDAMLNRCEKDVVIGADFYDYLMEEWLDQAETPNPRTGLSIEDAYRLEAFVCFWMSKQAQRGFRLDIDYAFDLVKELDEKIADIVKNAIPHMPLKLSKKKINHDVLRKAAEKAGQKYLLEGEQKLQVGCKKLGHKADSINKKLLKSWKKKGGSKKTFIARRQAAVYEITKITHTSKRATIWNVVTKTGNYSSYVKKDYPEYANGNINDIKNPVVVGPYTPLVWEEITLGNRDIVRITLYELGWRGVNLTDGEQKFFETNNTLPYYYAGKLDDDSIDAWKIRAEKRKEEVPEWAIKILEYYILNSRRGQILNKKDMDYFESKGVLPNHAAQGRCIRGLVPAAYDSATGLKFQDYIVKYGAKYWNKRKWTSDDEFRVPAEAISIGTNTFRMRHKHVVNIPARGLYGKEMRRLFIASKGMKIIGCDGSGLELRMLSHFMRDAEYEDVLLNGDIHNHNQNKAHLDTRDLAKKFIYMFLYGAGFDAMAAACGIPSSKMEECVNSFLDELPLLKDLIDQVKEAAVERGYLLCVDGRRGRVRKDKGKVKEHTALNVLLQMTGSVCMKWGLYFAIKFFDKHGIDPLLVCNMHDEIQMEVPEDEVEEIVYKIKSEDWKEEEKRVMLRDDGDYWSAPTILKGNPKEDKKVKIVRYYHKAGHLICKAFEDSGKYLGIRTPLAGEYKIGNSWAETH